MIKRTPWFERAFSLDVDLSLFPNIIERLRGTPCRLEDRTHSISPEVLTAKPNEAWSIQENTGHLLDLEPIWLGRLDDLLSSEDVLRPADLENRKTHEANHNASSIKSLLAAFRKARFKLVERLDEMDESSATASSLHPRLQQPMRVVDLAFFIAEHDDHHLAQITHILSLENRSSPG